MVRLKRRRPLHNFLITLHDRGWQSAAVGGSRGSGAADNRTCSCRARALLITTAAAGEGCESGLIVASAVAVAATLAF